MFGYLTLFTALIISLSAAVYSILGLTAIFAAAFWPIVVLGGSLEVGKIVTTLWLHKYWNRAELQYKLYLCSAVAILMVLTSMGVFGFLSKAHLDQAVPSGDIQAQVQIFDDKIQTQKDNIKTARAALAQMDTAVDQVMGRSSDEKGADKAVAIRRSQARERGNLQNDISKAQSEIARLQEQRAPVASQARQVEAEVGPIKYIAALIYGDNPDANILEKAVRWVIILIVAVFDPLAITLLLAATKTFEWERGVDLFNAKNKDKKLEEESAESWFDRIRFWNRQKKPKTDDVIDESQFWIRNVEDVEPVVDQPTHISPEDYYRAMGLFDIPEQTVKNTTAEPEIEVSAKSEPDVEEPQEISVRKDPTTPGWMFGPGTPHPSTQSKPESEELVVADTVNDDDDDDSKVSIAEKQARRVWKEENPNDTVKRYKKLHASGVIDTFPWNDPEFRQRTNTEEGNLWVEDSNGEWVNAGPMSQFNFTDLGLEADNVPGSTQGEMRGFGTSFPETAVKGDMFLRVDQLPSVLYKFNGIRWIEVDKGLSDQHAYDDAYIDHLIEKISTGEYDPDLLSDAERDSIERRLNNNPRKA